MPKIRVPSFVMRDLELEHVIALPTYRRISRGIKTTCASCGKAVTDEFFFAGFATGQPNRIFHYDCLDSESKILVEWPKCQKCNKGVEVGTGHILNGNYIHTKCEAVKA